MTAQKIITQHLDIWTSAHKTRSTAGRGSNNKLELVGIKKLRELILELAVRGKLVPQDANDEPASELLEKIAAKKIKLIKEGKIKKEKPLPEIKDEEKPFELPRGWDWTQLGDITNFGLTTKLDVIDENCWVLDLEDIEKDTSKLLQKVRFSERGSLSNKNSFLKGDVLYGKLRPYLNKVIVADEDGVCTTEILPIRCYGDFDSHYFKLALKSPNFLSYVNARSYGMKMPRLGTDDGRQALIPLPPLAEQHRIVAKVDKLMAFCDQLEQTQSDNIAAHAELVEALLATLTNSTDHNELQNNWQRIAAHFDTLFTTEHSIDQLKQTILQLAVMGKLVPQNPNDEPASELLKKIAAEKAQLIKEGKIKKEKPLPEITEEEKPFELPSGWEWIKLDFIATRSEAGWSPQCNGHSRTDNKWGVLKVSAVSWGAYNPDENKELPDTLEPRPEYEVKAGDFLISRANTAELVAKAVVVPAHTPEKLMMSDKIIRFNFSSFINLDFIQLVNNSSQSRSYYAAVAGGTSSSMKNVSREQIRNLVLALPSLSEQNRIVIKVNELMTLCDTLKTNLQNAQTTQLALADALVEQAVE